MRNVLPTMLAAVTVFTLTAGVASADPYFTEGLEDQTVGQYPNQNGNFNLFAARDTSVGEYTRVTDTRANSGSKSALLLVPGPNDDTAGDAPATATSLFNQFNNPASSGIYKWSMYLEDADHNDIGNVQFLLRDGTTSNIPLNLFIGTEGVSENMGTNFSVDSTTTGIQFDQWHDITIQFDQDNTTGGNNGSYSLWVDNNKLIDNRSLHATNGQADITTIWLAGNVNGHKTYDDVSFQPIPEPASAGLLGLAGAALLMRRRR